MLRHATIWHPLAPHLPHQLRELVGLFVRAQRRHLQVLQLQPQDHLLLHLSRLGPVTQGALGRIAGLDKSWISRIVDRFVAEGLVERVPLAEDRRCLQLRLTPAGGQRARRLDQLLDAHAAQMLAGVAPAAQPALGAALQTLIDALRPAEPKT